MRVCASLLALATLIGAKFTVPASRDIAVQARTAFGTHARAIAVSAPFAVVNVRGWPLESQLYTGQALFRRFTLGWQWFYHVVVADGLTGLGRNLLGARLADRRSAYACSRRFQREPR